VLSDADVKRALSMPEAIEVCGNAFSQLSSGNAVVPMRTIMGTKRGASGFMPGFCPGQSPATDALGLKIVSLRPENPKENLPSIVAQVFLIDPKTGGPLVLMDATYLTLLRTAAGSGVATKLMAKENAKKLVVFGAGAQAVTHIEAMLVVRPTIKTVVILNRNQDKATTLCSQFSARFKEVSFSVSSSPKEALVGADVIVTVTASTTPLFDGNDVEPGCHLNCVGSHRANEREVDSVTAKKALLVADEIKACMQEAGDFLIPIKNGEITQDHVLAEIGQVVAGKQIRKSDKDITLFKSVGNAVQDVAVGYAVYQSALKLGLGTKVDTSAKL